MDLATVPRRDHASRRALLAITCALTLSSCEGGPTVDGLSQRLLDRYDLHASGSTTINPMEIGAAEEQGMPWGEYLSASRRIDLDFSRWYGRSAEVRTTAIEGDAPNTRLHVLVLGERTIGAWLSAGEASIGGSLIYPLDDPP